MKKENKTINAYHDKNYCQSADIKIGILSNSLNYGTGIIESIRVYKKDGHYYTLGINNYIKRFITAIEKKGFKLDIGFKDIIRILQILLGKNQNIQHPYFRLVWYIGDESINTMSTDSHLAIVLIDFLVPQQSGLEACFSGFLRLNNSLNQLKLASNYSKNILEQHAAKKDGYNYVLFLGEKGEVLEGLSENIFIKVGNTIMTPKIGNILSGVNRAFIIESFKLKGIKVEERDIFPRELFLSDDIIVSGSATGVRYISKIENTPFTSRDLYKITKKFYEDININNTYITKLL